MKKIILIVLLLVAAGLGWNYRYTILKYYKKVPDFRDVLSGNNFLADLKQQIFTPGPLRSDQNFTNAVLTKSGVMFWTNVQRKQNGGLPALAESVKLNQAAEAKLKDMFDKQYFEHISPSGAGPGDLAKKAGYEYVVVGENLALGNFKDDQALVQAWMDSPGHRANILNGKYTQIGVAVGKGTFEGRSVWLAVQEFGRPLSSCPAVDPSLKTLISTVQQQVNEQETELKTAKENLNNQNPKTKEEYDEYNRKVEEFNTMVREYNAKVEGLKDLINTYNNQVRQFNACVS